MSFQTALIVSSISFYFALIGYELALDALSSVFKKS